MSDNSPKRNHHQIPMFYDEMTYYGGSSTSVSVPIVAEKRRYYNGDVEMIFKLDTPPTTVSRWGNIHGTVTATTSLPMGWREAEEQDTTARVEKAKKKRVANEKEIKRLVMGPKASRWR